MDITITYLLIIISLIITLSAQLFISTAYAKYTKIINKKQITGSEAARIILDKNGLNNIKINRVSGYLTDHYKPQQKVINLLMFSLCHLKKITKVPNTVDNPASDDKRNGIKKDIVSPNKVYVLNQILRIFLFNF